jgi:hypothetical protein
VIGVTCCRFGGSRQPALLRPTFDAFLAQHHLQRHRDVRPDGQRPRQWARPGRDGIRVPHVRLPNLGGIKPMLSYTVHDMRERVPKCGAVPVQCVKLTDEELWRAIAENTNAMSALVLEQLELEQATSSIPEKRPALMHSHLQIIDKYRRDYQDCTSELRRRYPC